MSQHSTPSANTRSMVRSRSRECPDNREEQKSQHASRNSSQDRCHRFQVPIAQIQINANSQCAERVLAQEVEDFQGQQQVFRTAISARVSEQGDLVQQLVARLDQVTQQVVHSTQASNTHFQEVTAQATLLAQAQTAQATALAQVQAQAQAARVSEASRVAAEATRVTAEAARAARAAEAARVAEVARIIETARLAEIVRVAAEVDRAARAAEASRVAAAAEANRAAQAAKAAAQAAAQTRHSSPSRDHDSIRDVSHSFSDRSYGSGSRW